MWKFIEFYREVPFDMGYTDTLCPDYKNSYKKADTLIINIKDHTLHKIAEAMSITSEDIDRKLKTLIK